jgi:hypothetical protein
MGPVLERRQAMKNSVRGIPGVRSGHIWGLRIVTKGVKVLLRLLLMSSF